MRNTTFYVPEEAIQEVVQFIDDNDISNSIEGMTEDGELILEISYEREESAIIEELHAILENYEEEDDEEEDDEEEDDDENEE